MQRATGTAAAGSDYVTSSGSLSFIAGGALTQTISVTINGDTAVETDAGVQRHAFEPCEHQRRGRTDRCDRSRHDHQQRYRRAGDPDPPGSGRVLLLRPSSPAEGIAHATTPQPPRQVTVTAIVTAIDTFGSVQGFYITEPTAEWDANNFTSEGIFVRTTTPVSGLMVGERRHCHRQCDGISGFHQPAAHFPGQCNGAAGQRQQRAAHVRHRRHGRPQDPDRYHQRRQSRLQGFERCRAARSTRSATRSTSDETAEGMRVTLVDTIVADGFVGGSNDNFVFFNAYSRANADASLLNACAAALPPRAIRSFIRSIPPTPTTTLSSAAPRCTTARHTATFFTPDFGGVGRGGAAAFDQLLTMGDELGNVFGHH